MFLRHNPYFNRWFSAILLKKNINTYVYTVTILILIDGFLQFEIIVFKQKKDKGHNPYFNRWFSAMSFKLTPSEMKKLSQSLF